MSPTAPRQPLPEHIDQNIENVVAITKREWEQLGHWQRRVEHIGRFVSRPVYIVGLLSFAGAWVAVNVAASLYGRKPFDPFPFPLLDGILTLCALLTTTVVLIAQSRQAKLVQQHTHLDLQVSLLTEQKVSAIIRLLEELRRDLPMVKNRHDPQASVLQEAADTAQVVSAIKQGGLTGDTGAKQTGTSSDDDRKR